jgi:hypothetical protein
MLRGAAYALLFCYARAVFAMALTRNTFVLLAEQWRQVQLPQTSQDAPPGVIAATVSIPLRPARSFFLVPTNVLLHILPLIPSPLPSRPFQLLLLVPSGACGLDARLV